MIWGHTINTISIPSYNMHNSTNHINIFIRGFRGRPLHWRCLFMACISQYAPFYSRLQSVSIVYIFINGIQRITWNMVAELSGICVTCSVWTKGIYAATRCRIHVTCCVSIRYICCAMAHMQHVVFVLHNLQHINSWSLRYILVECSYKVTTCVMGYIIHITI